VDALGHLTDKKLKFRATTSNDSTLVARGRKIKKTMKQLAAGEKTRIGAKLKHPKRLNKQLNKVAGPTVKVKVKATDEFGQSVSREFEVAVGPPE
jgi:hypothetical protein